MRLTALRLRSAEFLCRDGRDLRQKVLSSALLAANVGQAGCNHSI